MITMFIDAILYCLVVGHAVFAVCFWTGALINATIQWLEDLGSLFK